MRSDEWVQPILVGPNGSHLSVIAAAARASVQAFAADPHGRPWRHWLSHSFTKTVRRARAAHLRAAIAEGGVQVTGTDGAEAVALSPRPYRDLPRYVRQAQVQGLKRAAPTPSWAPSAGVWVALDADLGMSTGKAAAQGSHALMGYAYALNGPHAATLRSVAAQASFAWVPRHTFDRLLASAPVRIVDAGHTEVDPGTCTAVALQI